MVVHVYKCKACKPSQFMSNSCLMTVSVTSLLRKLKQQSRESLEARRPALIQALKELGDFYLELKWDFQSWGE